MLKASAVMAVTGVLLSWLPVIGPLLAGFLGGREAGTPPRALGAAVIPAVLVGIVVWLVLWAFDLPVLGVVAGIGVVVVLLVQLAPLLLGAWIGGTSDTAAR